MRALTICLLWLPLASVAQTSDQWIVELIVFERPGAQAHAYAQAPATRLTASAALAPASDALAMERGLPVALADGQRQLGNVWYALDRSESFRPVAHFAWQQRPFSRRSQSTLELIADSDQWRVDLDAQLSQGRFMHLMLDATIAAPDPELAQAEGRYRIIDSIQISTTQLAYYDHPKFGIVAGLRAVDAEPEDG